MARLLSRSERFFLVIGVVLLVVYVAARLRGEILSRFDLWHFKEEQVAAERGSSLPGQPLTGAKVGAVDVSLWSMQRIEAYQEALLTDVDAPIAVVTIPRLGLDVAVFEGTDDLTLNRGAGRIPGTAEPGEPGNLGLAAHRDGFFRVLKDIQLGDEIDLSATGVEELYHVDNIEIAKPSDVSVLRSRGQSSLTLVTCYPFYFVGRAPQRFIVQASKVESPRTESQDLIASRKEKRRIHNENNN
jgi:sortase A